MSIVKDLSLSPSGLQKIQWVRDFMPALGGIEARFEKEKPFAGLRVAVSVHLEASSRSSCGGENSGGLGMYLPKTSYIRPLLTASFIFVKSNSEGLSL